MKKIKFKIDEKTYNEAKKLTQGEYKLFSNFSELVRTAIREEYKKVFGEWPPPQKSVYNYILEKRLKELKHKNKGIYSKKLI